nr:nuclear envelope pore membrane protein POM 121C-like [Camelus dromedarius]
MGDYLSTPCPSAPPRALGGQHLPRGPGHLQPTPRHRRLPLAGPGRPALHQLLAARRPAYRCPVTLHRHLVTALHRRCSLLPRTLRSFLGILSSTCSLIRRRRAALRAQTSTLSCSSASPAGTATVCAVKEQPRTPALPTTPGCALDSCTEAVSRAPGESGKGLGKQGEDLAVPEGEDQRSPDGTGGEEPEMRHLWVQRGPVSFIPRPGSLQRNLCANNSEDVCVEKPQTSCVSSCPRRDAINSSYSSSQGSPPLRRKRGPARSGLPPKPLKKSRKESPECPQTAPSGGLAVFTRCADHQWEHLPPLQAPPKTAPMTPVAFKPPPTSIFYQFVIQEIPHGQSASTQPVFCNLTWSPVAVQLPAYMPSVVTRAGPKTLGHCPRICQIEKSPQPRARKNSPAKVDVGTGRVEAARLHSGHRMSSHKVRARPSPSRAWLHHQGAAGTSRHNSKVGITSLEAKRQIMDLNGRGEPLRLPPPPELRSRVTSEDLNVEKKAAFRQINSMLRGETEAGLAPPPSPDAEVTPKETTPPSQPLLSGAPQTTSGIILPPLQAPQMAPSSDQAFVTPAQGTGVTPMNSSVPSQPLLSGASQTTSGSILPPLKVPQMAPSGGQAFVIPAQGTGVTPMETTPPSQPLLSGASQTTSGSILPTQQAPQTAPSGGLAIFTPSSDSGVTPMETTPPSQALLSGASQTTSGSILPPLQAPQTAPSGALAFVTPAQGTGVTPINSIVSSQPLLSGASQTTSGSILPPLKAPQTAPSGALAIFTPSSDSGVTPMETTPPSQPLLSGASQTTSGSILAPLQAPQMAPSGGLAVFTPAQGTGVTPMNSIVSSQPLLSGAPQTTSGSILPSLKAPQMAPSGGLAVFTPFSDSGVTPMDTTPPSQALLSGAPQTTSGSILPPLKAPQTAPSGALAFVNPAQGTGVTPMYSTVPSQPLLSGAPQTTSGSILAPLGPAYGRLGGLAFVTLAQGLGSPPMNTLYLLSSALGAPQPPVGASFPISMPADGLPVGAWPSSHPCLRGLGSPR